MMMTNDIIQQRRPAVTVWSTGDIPEKAEGAFRFVCLSDTHEKHHELIVPNGDCLLHGDFTDDGRDEAVVNFNHFLGSLPHPHKIVILGNHELFYAGLEISSNNSKKRGKAKQSKSVLQKLKTMFGGGGGGTSDGGGSGGECLEEEAPKVKRALTNCTVLEDNEITINGIRIYGLPWHFAKSFDETKKLYDRIPNGIDIVMSHKPPYGIRDIRFAPGSKELLANVQRVKPLVHLFGHIHESYGVENIDNIVYINASNVDRDTRNPVIVFDVM